MRRLADAAAIDPAAFDELVALPRFAGGEADEQRDEHADERCRSPARSVLEVRLTTSASHAPCARSTSSTQLAHRAAAAGMRLTQCTRDRTSATASAGAADSPTRRAPAGPAGRRPCTRPHRPVRPRPSSNVLERLALVRAALDHELDPELGRATRRRLRRPAAQQPDLEPLALRPRRAPRRRGWRTPSTSPPSAVIDDRAVGQHAVDIQQQQPDAAGAGVELPRA